ncbi:MAG: Ni/Fe-hydrogenase cytochrome b subunit [Bacteroidetes bacterium]|nr:Ni/Fe-hydrogenase cytochrome b subunit [Bacteroidota bacterium]
MKNYLKHWTFWKAVAALLLAIGAVATVVRFGLGLGAATNLNDQFPWGIWIGFDVLCGVGLAAGGFTIASIVYIFNIKRFEPIIRPTILTAFLGYLLVIVALMFDLGRPWAIWHAIIMWNPHSVMFEVAWCVMLYTTVLSLEFAPVILEKYNMTKTIKVLKRISIPVIILGVLLSTLHQSSLGTLYLIVPEKLYGLWYSPYLPVFFYFSAIAVGCAMVIFESFLSSRAFKRGLELPLLSQIGKVCVMMLSIYAAMKIVDLKDRNALNLLFIPRTETYLFWAEVTIGIIIPIAVLVQRRLRENRRWLFVSAAMVVIGFIMNRMNITVTGMEAASGTTYIPSFLEFGTTIGIVTFGFVAFYYIAKYFPVFTEEHHDEMHEAVTASQAWSKDIKKVSHAL